MEIALVFPRPWNSLGIHSCPNINPNNQIGLIGTIGYDYNNIIGIGSKATHHPLSICCFQPLLLPHLWRYQRG